VNAAVQRGIDILGGAGKFARAGEKILLKVNLLAGDAPDKCVTTHPSVFRAVAGIMKSAGATVSFGDSPAFGSTAAAAKKSLLAEAGLAAGIELKEFADGEEIVFPAGKQNKKFTIAKAVLESDGVISLPKLKSHGFMKFTGAIKNQFGCVPGLRKGEFHVRIPDAIDFAKMLVDLDSFVRPRLYVMDGIEAMEGNGPRGGDPRKMNVLLFSQDPVALDATACRLINLDPALVPTTAFGQEYGRGSYENIELLGDDIEQFIKTDFIVDRSKLRPFKYRGIARFLNNLIVARPVIDKSKCVKCGVCINVCPVNPKAVNWSGGDKKQFPVHEYSRCIRCFCCQELCPEKAIRLQKPFLKRLFGSKH
jgi:uncharacterized protein (DUF362 family)/Pyruvate/2-oxoacid:ferredoxin oxidoreductase delta subunit